MSQELFEMTTEQGTQVSFAVLEPHQCAIVRDGKIIETYAADDAGIGRALKRYFIIIEECGGARHPFQALDGSYAHPHVG
jgi:hypothetical protein